MPTRTELPEDPPRSGWARRALGRAALVLASLALGLGVGEVVMRIALPMRRGVSWYHYDPRYEYKHRENADQITTEWGEGTPWRFRTNARGFRWPDWPDAPAPGKARVLVMGDSFTFGDGLDGEQAFPEVADAALGREGPWEVLNMGVSAWGPQNALGYIETEGAPIRGSCLIYAFYEGNDVLDSYVHPLYQLDAAGALVRIPPKAGPPGTIETVRDVMRRVPVYDELLAHSQLFNVARMTMMVWLTRREARRIVQRGELEDVNKIRPETFEKAKDLTLVTLDHLAALARERFGAFALLMIPLRDRMIRAPDAAPPAPSSDAWVAQQSHDAVVAWAKARGVPVVDASPEIGRDPATARRFYFTLDFHMNAEGNRAMGALLAREIPRACAAAPPVDVTAPPARPDPGR